MPRTLERDRVADGDVLVSEGMVPDTLPADWTPDPLERSFGTAHDIYADLGTMSLADLPKPRSFDRDVTRDGMHFPQREQIRRPESRYLGSLTVRQREDLQ